MCSAGLTPEQMRQAFARDCGGLRFREPCLTQEILKFGKGREIAVLQAGLHASDKRTAICREIHDRHFPKLQLFKQVDAGALGICFPLDCLIADRRSEEHTSELQSLMRISYAVFCLKKKTLYAYISIITIYINGQEGII